MYFQRSPRLLYIALPCVVLLVLYFKPTIFGNPVSQTSMSSPALVIDSVVPYQVMEKDQVNWTKVLHFVPADKQGRGRCKRWFGRATRDHPGPEIQQRYQKYYADFMKELKIQEARGLDRSPSVEGRTKQIQTYLALGNLEFVNVVCEIGFNVGHSTVAWLASDLKNRVYTFDIATHTATKPMAEYFMRTYPGRFDITYGDSLKVVPQWTERGIKCDIISIDGGHSYGIAVGDLVNMRAAANKKHILVSN